MLKKIIIDINMCIIMSFISPNVIRFFSTKVEIFFDIMKVRNIIFNIFIQIYTNLFKIIKFEKRINIYDMKSNNSCHF